MSIQRDQTDAQRIDVDEDVVSLFAYQSKAGDQGWVRARNLSVCSSDKTMNYSGNQIVYRVATHNDCIDFRNSWFSWTLRCQATGSSNTTPDTDYFDADDTLNVDFPEVLNFGLAKAMPAMAYMSANYVALADPEASTPVYVSNAIAGVKHKMRKGTLSYPTIDIYKTASSNISRVGNPVLGGIHMSGFKGSVVVYDAWSERIEARYSVFAGSVRSLIRYVDIRAAGGQVLEHIQDVDMLESFLLTVSGSDDKHVKHGYLDGRHHGQTLAQACPASAYFGKGDGTAGSATAAFGVVMSNSPFNDLNVSSVYRMNQSAWNNISRTYAFRLHSSGLMNKAQLFPCFTLKGIQITFALNETQDCFTLQAPIGNRSPTLTGAEILNSSGNHSAALTYMVYSPKFYVTLVEPSAAIKSVIGRSLEGGVPFVTQEWNTQFIDPNVGQTRLTLNAQARLTHAQMLVVKPLAVGRNESARWFFQPYWGLDPYVKSRRTHLGPDGWPAIPLREDQNRSVALKAASRVIAMQITGQWSEPDNDNAVLNMNRWNGRATEQRSYTLSAATSGIIPDSQDVFTDELFYQGLLGVETSDWESQYAVDAATEYAYDTSEQTFRDSVAPYFFIGTCLQSSPGVSGSAVSLVNGSDLSLELDMDSPLATFQMEQFDTAGDGLLTSTLYTVSKTSTSVQLATQTMWAAILYTQLMVIRAGEAVDIEK